MKKLLRNLQQKWGYAVIGLITAFKEEKSLLAYIVIFAGLIGLGVYAKLSMIQWTIMALIMFLLICVEIINTALEAAVDTISFQYNVKVKKIKDIASAATLVMTLGAVVGITLIFVSAFTGVI